MELLAEVVNKSKALGFHGMGCIHPRQIKVVHDNYAPGAAEIEMAKKIVNAFHLATEKGLGVVSLGSKMIDPPVVKRAQTTIDMAIDVGMLDFDWRDNYVG
jgi:citrate lyase subunit beta/citryl-CoA lyase